MRLLGRLDVNWSYAHLLRGCNAPPPHNLRTRATSMFWLQGISCYATQSALTEYLVYIFFFFFTHLLSSFWTSRGHRCRPFSPPVLAFNFYRTQGSAIPLLVDFSSSVANSRSCAFRKSICAQEKVPTVLFEYALGGIQTHETDLPVYQAQG